MKIFSIIFFATILSASSGEILRFGLGNNVAFRFLDLMLFLSCLFFFYALFRNKKLPQGSLRNSISVFALFGFFSLLLNTVHYSSEQILVAGLYLLRWLMYALSYLIVLHLGKKASGAISKILLAQGLIILIFGYFQYFFYPNLRYLFYLGWDEHNYRMFSVFFDPNFAGTYFVLYLLLTLHLLQNEIAGSKRLSRIAGYGLVSFAAFVAIFLTYSRSALLMLIVSASVYIMLTGSKRLFAYLFGAISFILIIFSSTFDKENTNLLRRTSSFARVESYVNALQIIEDKPLFGVGFNTYRYAQQSYGLKEAITDFPNHADAGVDSSLLFTWATTGIFGLAAYLYIWAKIVKLAYKKFNNNKKSLSIVLLSSISGLSINSIFINSLFFPFIMLWMWTITGLVEGE